MATHVRCSCIAAKLNYNIYYVNCNLSIGHTQSIVNSCMLFQHCTMSRFWQLFVLLCITKLAQSTSQHYFVLHSLHKALPSTTLYYKACTKHFPVLLCTTKLAQSTSQLKNILTNHWHSRDAATPILFTRSSCKDNSITTHAAATPSNLDAATTMRSADTELRNTIELRATASEIAAPQPISTPKRKKEDFEALFKRNFTRKIASAKIEKSADKSLSQLSYSHSNTMYEIQLQKTIYSITHAAAAPSNLNATISMRSANTDSRNSKNYAHRNNHSLQNTEGEPITRERPQPQPPHTRGTFHRRLQPLYTEKYKVSCSGFLPKTKPMQHACSHYNTFRSIP